LIDKNKKLTIKIQGLICFLPFIATYMPNRTTPQQKQ